MLGLEHPEGSALRVATLGEIGEPGQGPWLLSGPDATFFEIDGGALRFRVDGKPYLPDFERPDDADGDNLYEVTVTGGDGGERRVGVRVADRDEPGRVRLSPSRASQGRPLSAELLDPDGGVRSVRWRWERSIGPDAFAVIEGAESAVYLPTAADTGRHLRAVATYADRRSTAGTVTASGTTPNAVVGPRLLSLAARTESDPGGPGLKPAFDPGVLHYAVACGETDVLTLSFAMPPGVRVDVNGTQPMVGSESGAAVAVTETSDVVLTLAGRDGASTRYTVHCAPEALAAIGTRVSDETIPDVLLSMVVGTYVAVIDEHGVPRRHLRVGGSGERGAGIFLRAFGTGTERRWAHVTREPVAEGQDRRVWTIRDSAFRPVATFTTAAPLTTTGVHDFRMLDDGSILLMTYEPAVRDLSFLSRDGEAAVRFDDPDGAPWGEEVEARDSAIQLLDPGGKARWTWSSWGRLPLEDCAQHRFPDDYAHVNSLQMTAGGVLASFRGCSSVMLIDPDAPPGEEIAWRIGQSNLGPEDWEARGLGPEPLRVAGDPEGAFCGQHAASLLTGGPEPRLLLFDNGTACVADPANGEPLSRAGEDYSRVVEYAVDLANGEAVFVRDHSLGGLRSVLGNPGGHVEALPGGGWLVSWGRLGGESGAADAGDDGTKPPDAAVTIVDPATGEETFAVLRTGLAGFASEVRALAVSRTAFAPAPEPLSAFFPEAAPDRVTDDEGRSIVSVAVAFSRPVADFGLDTPSIEVTGGTLVGVAPRTEFGKPAHGYLLAIAPEGTGPVTVRLAPGIPCDEGGICAADGTPLSGVPAPWTLP